MASPTDSQASIQTTMAMEADDPSKARMNSGLMINYNVKYGSQEFTWVEHNCEALHKAK